MVKTYLAKFCFSSLIFSIVQNIAFADIEMNALTASSVEDISSCQLDNPLIRLSFRAQYGIEGILDELKSSQQTPDCLKSKFEDIRKICGKMLAQGMPSSWIDDCVWSAFLENRTWAGGGLSGYQPYTRFIIPTEYHKPIWTVSDLDTIDMYFITVYLNDSCQQKSEDELSLDQRNSVCSHAEYRLLFSPISLIWDEHTNINTMTTITQFPLDPTQSEKWFLWKGSAKTPLLVYDPLHKGKITTAYQLLGQWAFGGRGTDLHQSHLNNNRPLKEPWENGYEALSILDSDRDGYITGEELAPLALWFDYNQNSISEPGEVISALKAGITSLNVKPNRLDPKTQDIYSDKGFVRVENGKSISGKTVDWFSPSANSSLELLHTAQLQAGYKSDQPTSNLTQLHFEGEQRTTQKSPEENTFIGGWDWQLPDAIDANKSGTKAYLTLTKTVEGLVKGHIYYELPLQGHNNSILSTINIATLEGIELPDGKSIKFVHKSAGGISITNEASISNDGKNLIGKSHLQLGDADSKPISYNWIASRN